MTSQIQNIEAPIISQPLKLEDTNARDNAIVKAVETVFTAMAVAVNQRNPTLMSGYNTTLFAQSATDLLAQANLISHSLSKIGSDDLIIYHTILCGLTLLLGPGKDAVLTILSSPQIVRAVSQTDEFKAVKQQLLVSCSKYLATKGAKKLFKDFVKSKSPTNPVEMFQNLETSIKNYFFGCKKNLRAIQKAGEKLVSELQTSGVSLDSTNATVDACHAIQNAATKVMTPQISTSSPPALPSPSLFSFMYNAWSLLGSSNISEFAPLATLNPNSTAGDVIISSLGVLAAYHYNAPISALLITLLASRYLPKDMKNISSLEPMTRSMQEKWTQLSQFVTDTANTIEEKLIEVGGSVEISSQFKAAFAQALGACLLIHIMPNTSPLTMALYTDAMLLSFGTLLESFQLANQDTFTGNQGYLFKLPYLIAIGAIFSGYSLAFTTFQNLIGGSWSPEIESEFNKLTNFFAALMTIPVLTDIIANSQDYKDFILTPLFSTLQTQTGLDEIQEEMGISNAALAQSYKIANIASNVLSFLFIKPAKTVATESSKLALTGMAIIGGGLAAYHPSIREAISAIKSSAVSLFHEGSKLYSRTQATNILQPFLGLPLAAAATTLPDVVSDPKSLKSLALASTTASTAFVTGSPAIAAATSYAISSLDYSQYLACCMVLLHIAALYTFMNF